MGQLFGWIWRPQTISSARGGHAHFPAKSGPKNQKSKIIILTWIPHRQSIDNTIIVSWVPIKMKPKMTELRQKTYAQIWAHIYMGTYALIGPLISTISILSCCFMHALSDRHIPFDEEVKITAKNEL